MKTETIYIITLTMLGIVKKIISKYLSSVYTLKFRIGFFATISLVLIVGGPLWFLVKQLDRNYEEFSSNMIETTTNALYQSIFEDLVINNPAGIQKIIENYALQPNIERLRIYRPNGEILFSSHRDEINKNIFSSEDYSAISERRFTENNETFFKFGNIYAHQHPLYIQKECLPCHTNQGKTIAFMDVQVGLNNSEFLYASIKRWLIASAIFMVVLLWLVFNFMYESQIESRLKKIMGGFHALANGDLNYRVEIPGKHELARLAAEFNNTVKKLNVAKLKEEKLIEENLARADRLITMGEVAAEIAHEVNNPAGIILTRAELVKDELQYKNGHTESLEDLDIIIGQTERIAETTRRVLHYARKLPQSFSAMDLNEVIQHSINILIPRIKKSGVQITFTPLDKPALVRGDFNQLEQVFCNLINNSLDAVPPGKGSIFIDVKLCDTFEDVEGYCIVFRDNGPGIPAEIREEIFTPFFTTKGDGKGTGLGMFIVRNIINNHKGRIYLDDSQANGAIFNIELEAYHGEN